MKAVWKLGTAYFLRHPLRVCLTSLAIVAAACVVVWVVSGYDAVVAQFGEHAAEYLGHYDFFVVPEDENYAYLSAEIINALEQDPLVAEVAAVSQTPVRLINPNAGGPMSGGPLMFSGRSMQNGPRRDSKSASGAIPNRPPRRPSDATGGDQQAQGRGGPPDARSGGRPFFFRTPMLVGTDAPHPPYPLAEGVWLDPDLPEQRHGVLTKSLAEQLGVKPGDEVLVIFGPKEFSLKVVGIVEQGAMPMGVMMGAGATYGTKPNAAPTGLAAGPANAALYVSPFLAEKFTRGTAKINLINIKLKEPSSSSHLKQFRERWELRLADVHPAASLLGAGDLKAGMEESMPATNARRQAWAATGLSLLAALFIIFATLSMGVSERVRQFAMMRAVGLTRGQIAALIFVEGGLLALLGWAGGLAAGWGLLLLAAKAQPALFPNGVALGYRCLLFTGLAAGGGALAAAILPAWRATRVRPLDAMTPRQTPMPALRGLMPAAVIGLILIVINPLLVFVIEATDAARYALFEALGCTSMSVGFLLLAPAAIVLVEKLLGPVFARVLGLAPQLLRMQLTGNLWRTVGATAALCVGLGLFVAIQVWGYSMLQPFVPGDWVPDALIAFQMGGLPDVEIDAVRKSEGIIPEKCLPLAVEQPKLAEDLTGSRRHASVTRQDNVIIIGLDPLTAFGGSDPLLKVRFVQGSAEDAVAKLSQGRYCIVPDHFLSATGLKLGDRFALLPPEHPNKPVEYTIVGAVSLPGWHWMTKFSGLRRREGRSAAMVFAGYEQVRQDFELRQINFFWTSIDKNVGVDRVGKLLQPIAERNLGERQPVNPQGTWSFAARMFGPSIRITTPDDVRERILARAEAMIWAMSRLPLVTLLITSLGVVNTVMASVRARQWEFGVLRAMGITRCGLARLILAEGLLIAVIACLLSLGFGVLAGWCGTGISQYVSFFGGMDTPLLIPWMQLAMGFGITMGLCLLAAVWPAESAAFREPLSLLQAGRAAL